MDLSKIPKQRFDYRELWKLEPDMDYDQLSRLVEQLCEEGKIIPVKNSGKTSFFPPVYMEYKKLAQKKDYSAYLSEIAALHPKLSISRYLGKPEAFARSREKILLLSEFLWRQDGRPEKMSVKERSYAIWRDEKVMESEEGRKVLSFNGLDLLALYCYETPESFFSTRISRQGMVLVLENKDPWYSIGKALKEMETLVFCGKEVALLVYGEGNKVMRDGALTQFILDEERNLEVEVCYAGDIDRAGIGILYGVMSHNPRLKISPFHPLYEAMGEKAAEQLELGYPLKPSEDKRNLLWNREFIGFFSGKNRKTVEKALGENSLIPQEILAYPDYKGMCGSERKARNV